MKTNNGYTLIELLIAMLIYSIVAVIISNSLSNLLKIRERNQEHEFRLGEIQKALTLLERDIEQIVNRPILNSIGKLDSAFMMDSNISLQRIEFTRMGYINPSASLARSSLMRIGYQFKDNKLVRSTWPSLDRTQDTFPTEQIVLTQIDSMQWQFYDSRNKIYPIWPPTALWLQKIPRAVQVSITLKDKGKLTQLFVLPDNNNVFISQ